MHTQNKQGLLKPTQQTDKIYPLMEIRYSEYESQDWAELSSQGWRTVEVYKEDNTAFMIYQKYLH